MSRSLVAHKFSRLRIAFGAACALVVTASTPALACNPFELLFGGCRETQVLRPSAPIYYEPSQPAAARHVERPKVAHVPGATATGGGVSGRQKPMAATPDAPVGSLALFEKDKTLRAGDVVVTKDGFRVYKGGGVFAHIAQDGGSLSRLEKASMARNAVEAQVRIVQAGAKAPESAPVASAPVARTLKMSSTPIGLREHARARLTTVADGG
jgi:hypothetical protein